MSTVAITLTREQQKQLKDATDKNFTELNVDFASTGQLSEKDLDKVSGGRQGSGVEFMKLEFQ